MSYIIHLVLLGIGLILIVPNQVQAQACTDSIYKIVTPLIEQKQEASDWCAAASVRVATNSHGSTYSQCQLMSLAVGGNCCPAVDHQYDKLCNPTPPVWPDTILLKVSFTYSQYFYGPALPWVPLKTTSVRIVRSYRLLSLTIQEQNCTPLLWKDLVLSLSRLEEPFTTPTRLESLTLILDLCLSSCLTPADINPRFLTLEQFTENLFEHDRDYMNIKGTVSGSSPAAPANLQVR